jgi:hypothetical protein
MSKICVNGKLQIHWQGLRTRHLEWKVVARQRMRVHGRDSKRHGDTMRYLLIKNPSSARSSELKSS